MINSVEPAIDPKNRIDFLIDWELTLKCNLDCSYCMDSWDMDGGHWTLAKHPPVDECLKTVDFLYKYTDLYMQTKQKFSRRAVLNVYGGESLLHPNIVEILQHARDMHTYDWPLTVTTTTNAIIGAKRMREIIPLIDKFTLSYHTDSLPKQKELFKQNALEIKTQGQSSKIIIMMTNDYSKWDELTAIIQWCKDNEIEYLAKQLDNKHPSKVYNLAQLAWFANEYKQDLDYADGTNLSEKGRGCCGGRGLCTNDNLKDRKNWIPRVNFEGWSCSVNHYFLFVKQNDGRIFVNKDCRMNFNGKVEPIGTLQNSGVLLAETKQRLSAKEMPLMTCAKTRCLCGICAPKASTLEHTKQIMSKHTVNQAWQIN